MAGQPNRKGPGELERARPLIDPVTGKPAGLGNHEIDVSWPDTDDVLVLKDRLRRRKMQVEKLKEQRALARDAQRLKYEEGYTDALVELAPQLLAVDQKITAIVDQLLDGALDEDQVKLLKALLPELTKQRDRLYGKTRQRLSTTSLSASVDINALMNGGKTVPVLDEGDVVDVPVLEEEVDG